MMKELFDEASNAVTDANQDLVRSVVERALAAGIDAAELLEKGFIPGIAEVGEKFENEEIFLPRLFMSSEAMKLAAELCNKAIKSDEITSKGVVVLGTVQGDIHDIGKSIVASFLAASGFTVHDLGRDVSPEAFVDKAVEVNADVIGTSALLTTTMKAQKNLEDILKEESLKGKIKTMVGGVPVNQAWADSIGADGYAEDAAGAARKIKELVGK
ncbi:MAG: corrinoid protein [Deltaproteobacteria bacterium]|jgi:corrinoid protein of di/trimethylamine methyltransferase|nr:corrinoid protein [Deltaproteobacteria bacterium]MBW2543704.1 corrinoid protein [Deltaproteobacteria bacterium]